MARSIIRANSCLLWTNPNLSEAYGGGYVPLDLSEYRFVRVTFLAFHSYGDVGVSEIPKGTTGVLFYMQLLQDTASSAASFLNGVTRKCTVSETGVLFGNGQMVYNGYAYTNWENRAVPWQIFGIR